MPRKPKLDATLLQAALEGLELQRVDMERKIAAVRSMLGTREAGKGAAPPAAKPKRILSAAARTRIADAQKRRWALVKAKAAAKAAKKASRSAETA
jgi:hypothetical protein